MNPRFAICLVFAAVVSSSGAAVLYSNGGPITANETGAGVNLAGFSVARNNSATDTLYFRYFLGSPASNMENENYFAAMQLFESGAERLGVGNAWGAWAYSAFGVSGGDRDLNSTVPEPGASFQLVRGADNTQIVFRIDYVAGGDDSVTVWLNPDLSLPEAAQATALRTSFAANASFNELRLREGGGGAGWTFTNVAVATSGTDAGFFAVPEPSGALLAGLAGGGLLMRRRRSR
jgi:hypothetical protein